MEALSTKHCLICKHGRKNECLHWHHDTDSGDIWVYCVGKCQRGYSIYQYVNKAGITLKDFLKCEFDFKEAKPNEVNKMDWSSTFIPMSDPRAKAGVEYVESRGLKVGDGMYYDTWRKGIVFTYYFENIYCGAQVRLIHPWTDEDGAERKIDTIPGTRLGLLFYGWNQEKFVTDIKALVITEGAFNKLIIQQALDHLYGGVVRNPFKVVATSGAGISAHQISVLKDLKQEGIKIILALDSDEAGLKACKKIKNQDAATHYAFTNQLKYDWNDIGASVGIEDFGKWFLKQIKRM